MTVSRRAGPTGREPSVFQDLTVTAIVLIADAPAAYAKAFIQSHFTVTARCAAKNADCDDYLKDLFGHCAKVS